MCPCCMLCRSPLQTTTSKPPTRSSRKFKPTAPTRKLWKTLVSTLANSLECSSLGALILSQRIIHIIIGPAHCDRPLISDVVGKTKPDSSFDEDRPDSYYEVEGDAVNGMRITTSQYNKCMSAPFINTPPPPPL